MTFGGSATSLANIGRTSRSLETQDWFGAGALWDGQGSQGEDATDPDGKHAGVAIVCKIGFQESREIHHPSARTRREGGLRCHGVRAPLKAAAKNEL